MEKPSDLIIPGIRFASIEWRKQNLNFEFALRPLRSNKKYYGKRTFFCAKKHLLGICRVLWEISSYKSGDFLRWLRARIAPSSLKPLITNVYSFLAFRAFFLTHWQIWRLKYHIKITFFFFFGKKEDLSDCSSIRRHICIYRVTKSNHQTRS